MPNTIPRYVECGCGCNRMTDEEWEEAMLEAESNNFEDGPFENGDGTYRLYP